MFDAVFAAGVDPAAMLAPGALRRGRLVIWGSDLLGKKVMFGTFVLPCDAEPSPLYSLRCDDVMADMA